MSKGLDALKQVNELIKNVEEYKNKTGKDNPTICMSEKLLISIQNALQPALQRLEAIDNANPSEALECLEEIRDFRYGKDKLLVCQTEMYNTIKQALLKAQEQEKVLEIIKKKNVEVGTLITMIKVHPNRALNLYNECFDNTRRWLKQEEFDLLKRWLK